MLLRALLIILPALALGVLAAFLLPPLTPPQSPRTLPADTARSGTASALQNHYDVLSYHLRLKVDPERRHIAGRNLVTLRLLAETDRIELDLDPALAVSRADERAEQTQTRRTVMREGGKLYVALGRSVAAGTRLQLDIAYSGKPHVAVRAPWDGGFVWDQTPSGAPWVATAVQGKGCDLWWPCKDALGDKPDTLKLDITVPEPLVVAANGVLAGVSAAEPGWQTYRWRLDRPVSAYNIALNIAPYSRIERRVESLNGDSIPLHFYALADNRDKAERLVDEDLLAQIAYFEQRLGPYPFGGVKLGFAETPHLGMEHQTINAYGNRYRPGEHGFDWLLQHELAHEWFGNMMTQQAPRDFWLHEGFAMYMQPVYAEHVVGRVGRDHYLYRIHTELKNCFPVVPDTLAPGEEPDPTDVYRKGAWLLHTLRNTIGEAAFWRAVRRLLYDTPDPWSLAQPIAVRSRSTEDFIALVSDEAGRDMTWFFDVYARQPALPVLQSRSQADGSLQLWWETPIGPAFELPVEVAVGTRRITLAMTGGTALLPAAQLDGPVSLDPDMKILRRMPFSKSCAGNE